jgi:hypothetical protein
MIPVFLQHHTSFSNPSFPLLFSIPDLSEGNLYSFTHWILCLAQGHLQLLHFLLTSEMLPTSRRSFLPIIYSHLSILTPCLSSPGPAKFPHSKLQLQVQRNSSITALLFQPQQHCTAQVPLCFGWERHSHHSLQLSLPNPVFPTSAPDPPLTGAQDREWNLLIITLHTLCTNERKYG